MAILTRRTANETNNAPSVTTNTQGQTTGTPLQQVGSSGQQNLQTLQSRTGYAGGAYDPSYVNSYADDYGFGDPYGFYLLESNITNQPNGGYLPGYEPLSYGYAGYRNEGSSIDRNSSNTIQYGSSEGPFGGSISGGVTVAWDLGLRQSTRGTPEYFRNFLRMSDSAYGNTFASSTGDELVGILGERGRLSPGGGIYNQDTGKWLSWDQRIDAQLGGAFDFSTPREGGPGEWNARPITSVYSENDQQWYKTVQEIQTPYGLPGLLRGERFLPAAVAGTTGATTSPHYSLNPLSERQKSALFQNPGADAVVYNAMAQLQAGRDSMAFADGLDRSISQILGQSPTPGAGLTWKPNQVQSAFAQVPYDTTIGFVVDPKTGFATDTVSYGQAVTNTLLTVRNDAIVSRNDALFDATWSDQNSVAQIKAQQSAMSTLIQNKLSNPDTTGGYVKPISFSSYNSFGGYGW